MCHDAIPTGPRHQEWGIADVLGSPRSPVELADFDSLKSWSEARLGYLWRGNELLLVPKLGLGHWLVELARSALADLLWPIHALGKGQLGQLCQYPLMVGDRAIQAPYRVQAWPLPKATSPAPARTWP